MQYRIGQGYDLHRVIEARKFIIGGVQIPYEKGLLGHSDADVLAHAITDSLLGALSLGDIGTHFPDRDPKYKDADSIMLLKEAYNLVKDQGYLINNIDTTIQLEEPKMNPYIPIIEENLAKALEIDKSQISVKAKTMEKVGPIGAKEAVAVHAIALLIKK